MNTGECKRFWGTRRADAWEYYVQSGTKRYMCGRKPHVDRQIFGYGHRKVGNEKVWKRERVFIFHQ